LLKLVDLLELYILLMPHLDQQVFHPRKTGVDGPDDGGDNRRNRHTGRLLFLGHYRILLFRHEGKVCTRVNTLTALAMDYAARLARRPRKERLRR
jgi:hypothetical protein